MRSLLIAIVVLTGVHVYAQTTPTAAATQLKTQLEAVEGLTLTSASNTGRENCYGIGVGTVETSQTNCLGVSEICCDAFGDVATIFLNDKTFTSLAGVTLPDSLRKLVIVSNANFASLPSLPPNLLELTTRDGALTGTVPELPSSLQVLNVGNNPNLEGLPQLPESISSLYIGTTLIDSLPTVPASLTTLSAAQSKLTTVPDLPSALSFLDVTGCPINSLPAMPAALTALWAYNLRGDLTVLPDLSGAASLEDLDVYCSGSLKKLTSLGAGLPNSLTRLAAQDCALTAMPPYPSGATFTFDISGNEKWLCPVADNGWVGAASYQINPTSGVCVCPPGKNLPSGEASKSITERTCADSPTCDASTVLDNAADAGDCTATLAAAASCMQTPNAGFSCTASTCANEGTTLSAGSCSANPTCDASTALDNAADAGDCTATLAAGASCTQTPNAGFSCTASTCANEGTTLSAGSCTPESDSSASVVAGIWAAMAFTALF